MLGRHQSHSSCAGDAEHQVVLLSATGAQTDAHGAMFCARWLHPVLCQNPSIRLCLWPSACLMTLAMSAVTGRDGCQAMRVHSIELARLVLKSLFFSLTRFGKRPSSRRTCTMSTWPALRSEPCACCAVAGGDRCQAGARALRQASQPGKAAADHPAGHPGGVVLRPVRCLRQPVHPLPGCASSAFQCPMLFDSHACHSRARAAQPCCRLLQSPLPPTCQAVAGEEAPAGYLCH